MRHAPGPRRAGDRTILAVIQSPVFGGSHNRTLTIEPYLRRAGWRTTVVLPREPGDAAERLRAGGMDVVELPLHRLRATRDPRAHLALAASLALEVRGLAALMRERAIDLVRVVGIVHPHGALAARAAGLAVVFEVTDLSAPAALRRLVMPFAARLSDGMLFNGRTLLEIHRRAARIVVPHACYTPPVDLQRFTPDPARRSRARDQLGIAPDELLVGSIANMNPAKGVEYFARAAGIVARRDPRVRFLLVGATYHNHAAYAERVFAQLAAEGMDGDRFRVMGPRADLEEVYAALDVKVVSSISEGTTTTALEAMASGVPVVATDVGAVHEVIVDGTTGLLVVPRDPGALATGLLRLTEDAALRGAMSVAARDHAVAHFGAGQCTDVHLRLFEAALAHRVARRA